MSPSRHLSQEELEMLLGTNPSEPSQPIVSEAGASFQIEGTSGPDSSAFLKDSIRILSARVELLESELSLLRSQLTSHVQAAKHREAIADQIIQSDSAGVQTDMQRLAAPHSVIPEGSVSHDLHMSQPPSPNVPEISETALTPRSVKHRKKGIITKLFE